MKIGMLITAILLVALEINAMEEKAPSLEGMLFEPASLKFQAAWQVAQGTIPEGKAPKEVLEFVDKIRVVQACTDCSEEEKKLFINILNDPKLDIEKGFPNIIKKYLGKKKFTGPKQLFDVMLRKAAENNQPSTIRLLIEFAADVNAKDNYGNTALIKAISKGNKEVIKLLLAADVNVNAKNDNGTTALIAAAQHRGKEIIQMLLDKKADVNAQNNGGGTALMEAVLTGKKEIAELLLDYGADVNAKDERNSTALMMAADAGKSAIVKMLLTRGADATFKNSWGRTALDFAIHMGYDEIAEMLRTVGN